MKHENGTGRDIAILCGGLAAGLVASRLLPPLVANLTASQRTRSGGDPFAVLIDDHRQIQSLLRRMADAGPAGTVQKTRLFLMLKRKLGKHALAEEDVVYPIVHNFSDEADHSKHLYEEHSGMKILLYDIEDQLSQGADWSSSVAALSELINGHIADEEQNVFPQLRQRLSTERKPGVSGKISREEALIA